MLSKPPASFRVIAIISTYNEEDIIVPVIKHLVNEGISIYVIDNWSTDQTFKILKENKQYLIGLERFPKDNPSPTYDWEDILKRKEQLSQSLIADWFMHHDADEIRESPWPGITLRDAIYIVDKNRYNAIEFELLDFFPINNDYHPGSDPKKYFQYYQLNTKVINKYQIKAWKSTNHQVIFAKYGGHYVEFPDINVFPYKFIMRHYPIRSQKHGEKKIFQERNPRINLAEKQRRWHVQYEEINKGESFLKNPSILTKFSQSFYIEYMIKQLLEHEKTVKGIFINYKNEINQFKSEIEKLNNEIIKLNNEIIKLNNEIVNYESKLTSCTQFITDLNSQVEEKDESINSLMTKLKEREKKYNDLHTQMNSQGMLINDLNIKLANQEQEILFYALSKSWSITRPMRKLMRFIKGKRNV